MKLRKYMNENDISFREIADRLEVTTVCVRFWCNGSRRPRPAAISAIESYTHGAVVERDFGPKRRRVTEKKVLKMVTKTKPAKKPVKAPAKKPAKKAPAKKAVGRPRKVA